MRSYGDPSSDTMLVWVHGDLSRGGPANYHFAISEQAAQELQNRQVPAHYVEVAEATHNSALRSPQVMEVIRDLIAAH